MHILTKILCLEAVIQNSYCAYPQLHRDTTVHKFMLKIVGFFLLIPQGLAPATKNMILVHITTQGKTLWQTLPRFNPFLALFFTKYVNSPPQFYRLVLLLSHYACFLTSRPFFPPPPHFFPFVLLLSHYAWFLPPPPPPQASYFLI